MEYTQEQLKEFLEQSNAIEGVYDNQSLLDSFDAWEYLQTQDELNHKVVKQVHKILMQSQPLLKKEIGNYRTCKVWVGGHEGLDYKKIDAAMKVWCGKNNRTICVDEQKLHVEYEKIHPFVDGNGRTGRMFYNWLRLKNGKELDIIYKKNVRDYYSWFDD